MSPRALRTWEGQSLAELRQRWRRESVHVFGTVESTNDAALELMEAGAEHGCIVIARQQTAGRGREGRPWDSPAGGGLYLSMVFHLEGPVSPLVTIVAGVDIAQSLNASFSGLGARVKWPNDLIARDLKLGGILAEARRGEDGGQRLIVGVGINVKARSFKDGFDGAVALDACVDRVELSAVADAVIKGLEQRVPTVGEGLTEAELDALDRLDWLKNRRIRHHLGEAEPTEGVASGIAPDGALLLRPDRGALRRVVAGSVEVVA